MAQVPSGAPTMWQPTIPVDQSIYEDNTTQQAPLGTRLCVGDRVFYYASVSASVARGTILCAVAPTASHNGALCTFAATSAGVTTPTITAGSAITANEYAEGYMGISKGTQGGAVYRIKSHPAIGSAASGTLTLYDGLIDDVAAADEVGLVRNIYRQAAVASSALAAIPVGIPMVDITASGYAWIQSYGPAAPLNQAATPASVAVKVGTTGGVLAMRAGTTAGTPVAVEVGQNYALAGSTGEYTPIFLKIRQ